MHHSFSKQLFIFSVLVLSVSAWFYFSASQAQDLSEEIGPRVFEASIEGQTLEAQNKPKLSDSVQDEPRLQRLSIEHEDALAPAQNTQVKEHQLSAVISIAKTLDFQSPPALSEEYRQRWPVASITKLMTAIVALEEIGSEEVISFSPYAIAGEGNAGGFSIGEQFKVSDLVKAMIMVSSNDAALALAEHFGEEEFLAVMAQKAQDIGMQNTQFVDPSGLSYLNQSTVSDLERLFAYIYDEHPEILSFSRERSTTIVELGSSQLRKLFSIIEIGGHPEFLGGKTGYIDEAGGNFVALFEGRERPVMVAVLGSLNRFADTLSLYQQYKENQ